MKRILITLLIITPLFAIAQHNEGKIIYNETRQFNFDFKDHPEMKRFVDKMPKERTSQKQLTFNSESSLFENYENLNTEGQGGRSFTTASGGHVEMNFRRPSSLVYRNITDKQTIESREFMSKKFLIKGEEAPVWKIKPEQMKIKDYVCQRAEWEKDSATYVVAWFTPQIPISSGPGEYVGLPGMVLKVDVNDGNIVIEANEISFEEVDKNALVEPTKGKEVTREEFKAIMKEKMEEMREMRGGAGNKVIMIRD